jgi:hypothetical protein
MISVYLLSRGKLNAETKRRDDSVKAASRSDESILVVTNDVERPAQGEFITHLAIKYP